MVKANKALGKEQLDELRWLKLCERDTNGDEDFVYAVRSTGIYCRPGCPSRLPKKENVVFFNTIEQAVKAGFRPCKRCKPDQVPLKKQHADKIAKVCRFIEESEAIPKLDELAEHVQLSPYHLHRMFKAITGLTPKAYAAAHLSREIRHQLTQAGSISDAIYNAGYNSNSRFYESSHQLLGMTPSKYRAKGKDTKIYYGIGKSTLGKVLVAQSNVGICAIFLGDDAQQLIQDLHDRFSLAEIIKGNINFKSTLTKVIKFIESPQIGLDLPLDIRGTVFQQQVWQALRKIPIGETISYKELSEKLGKPKSVRAVASACGANPLAIVIPCHRVIGSNGALSGYRWGLERKSVLLKKEGKK